MSTAVAIETFNPSYNWSPVGVSVESDEIRKRVHSYEADRHLPATLAWKGSLFQDVAEIRQTCAADGWDGYDGDPITSESAIGTVELLMNLPDGIQVPAVVPESNGNIALEWQADNHCLFSLSVTGPTIVWAGRFGGTSRQYGEERFFGIIPQKVMELLLRYFPQR